MKSKGRVLSLLLIAACESASSPPPDAPPAPQMEVSGAIDPITHLPKCARLATMERCCQLACSDEQAFIAECGIEGACSEWVCKVQGGDFFTAEVCKP